MNVTAAAQEYGIDVRVWVLRSLLRIYIAHYIA